MQIDGLSFRLTAPFDFSFVSEYGKVFKVFDDQDSGNICFGVEASSGERYFIKFAGAPTVRTCRSPEAAIATLKAAVSVYRDLRHECLVRLIDARDVGGGYAAVFAWVDAECMGRMYEKSREKFMQMPLESKLRVYEDILRFHAHVAACGYVAIDFYDGSIMYDFAHEKTLICDIDFYARQPYTNEMGRLWGSSRFMSPEEHVRGATIDEVSNVYAMGATAFALFAYYDRSRESWPLGEDAYRAAQKATSDVRESRPQSIREYLDAWRHALGS